MAKLHSDQEALNRYTADTALARYGSLDQTGAGSAGMDPRLAGSPAAIQQALGFGGAAFAPPKVDFGNLESVTTNLAQATDRLVTASEAQVRAAQSMASNARRDPITSRR